MAEGPTTLNGPLHTDEASLADRRITAYFASSAQAEATRDALQGQGVAAERITIAPAQTEAANLEPAEQNLLGRIREAVLPDDSQRATRAAIADGDVVLTVVPTGNEGEVDQIVNTIEAGRPSHFDARLERWRNAQPN